MTTYKTNGSETPTTLWQITRGQRLRYGGAITAMALTGLFLFGAPMIGKFAIDVVANSDLSQGMPGVAKRFIATETSTSDVSGDISGYLWASAALTYW